MTAVTNRPPHATTDPYAAHEHAARQHVTAARDQIDRIVARADASVALRALVSAPTLAACIARVIAADTAGGQALLDKSYAILDARELARQDGRGTWGRFLHATGLHERTAQRHIQIAERARHDERFRDAVQRGWLSYSVAALAAHADASLLDSLLTQDTPPTRAQVVTPEKPDTGVGFLTPPRAVARDTSATGAPTAQTVAVAQPHAGATGWQQQVDVLAGQATALGLTLTNDGDMVTITLPNDTAVQSADLTRIDRWLTQQQQAVAERNAYALERIGDPRVTLVRDAITMRIHDAVTAAGDDPLWRVVALALGPIGERGALANMPTPMLADYISAHIARLAWAGDVDPLLHLLAIGAPAAPAPPRDLADRLSELEQRIAAGTWDDAVLYDELAQLEEDLSDAAANLTDGTYHALATRLSAARRAQAAQEAA